MWVRAWVVGAVGLGLATSCEHPIPARAGPPGTPPELRTVVIENVPHVRQKPDFCGEAAAASALQARGAPFEQDDVFDWSGMDPARGMGVTTRELETALERIGFDVGPVWHRVSAKTAAAELRVEFGELHADLARGVPSIVCMRYDERPATTEHFRLILGYDAGTDSVVYHEPAEDDGAYRHMPLARFIALWPLKYGPDEWTVIRLRLEGTELAEPRPTSGTRPAAFAQHVMKLKARLPAGFEVVVEPPFVVVGDGNPGSVKTHSDKVVSWAVRLLEKEYFSTRPRPLDIWLFANENSYESYTKRLFGDAPSTPYGFYSKADGALVMNIATGGGTLVHEIVHPYVEVNFPNCPPWFNEGLGSLYEQSAERGGRIVGLTNWRLSGLKRAIREGRTLPIRELMAKTTSEFYGDESGVHYAESRYLLYYLQERELLKRYYSEFVDARQSDPTGYQTLLRVLEITDGTAFQRKWEAFVLGLRFD